jgi:hypothetical protein
MSDKGNNDLHRFAALQLSIIYSTVPINLGKVGTDPRKGLLFIGRTSGRYFQICRS